MPGQRQLTRFCRLGMLCTQRGIRAQTIAFQQHGLSTLSSGSRTSSASLNKWLNSYQWHSFKCFCQQASKPAESARPGWGKKSPISFNSMLLGLAAFLGIVAVAQRKAQDKVQGMMNRSQQVVGKAAVGGPFSLVDGDGKPFTEEKLLGQFNILYFGFTHCPDICPDELEKLAEAVDLVEKRSGSKVQPVFISIDPARDTPKLVKAYVKEFHPRLVGLTGSEEAVKKVSKAYRVYFHKTGDDDKDYLVDHSIIMYLIDPAGEFVTFYGKNFTAEQLADSICGHMEAWEQQGQAAAGAPAGPGQMGSQEGRAQR